MEHLPETDAELIHRLQGQVAALAEKVRTLEAQQGKAPGDFRMDTTPPRTTTPHCPNHDDRPPEKGYEHCAECLLA